MKPAKRTAAWLLAIATASITAGPAVAGSHGETSFGNIRYQLIDLDLNDGITPHLELQSQPLRAGYGIAMMDIVTDGVYAGSDSDDGWADTAAGPLALDADIAGNRIHVGMTGRAALSTLSITAGATTVQEQNTLGRGYSNLSGDTYGFTLTANTGVVFEADMRTVAQITGRAGLDQWYNARANMQVWLRGEAPDNSSGVDFFYGSEWLHQGVLANDDEELHTLDTEGTLRFAFQNIMDVTRGGSFVYTMQLNAGGTPVMPAIPEPATYMMLAAGIGICMAHARQRARRLS